MKYWIINYFVWTIAVTMYKYIGHASWFEAFSMGFFAVMLYVLSDIQTAVKSRKSISINLDKLSSDEYSEMVESVVDMVMK